MTDKPIKPNGIDGAVADLEAFHRAGDIPVLPVPAWPSDERIALRVALSAEEYVEMRKAIANRDLVATADAIFDLIYILIGNALEFGIPIAACWEHGHETNMAKVDQSTGKVKRRADGKIMKPEGWQPPDFAEVLNRALDDALAKAGFEVHGCATEGKNVLSINGHTLGEFDRQEAAELVINGGGK